VVELFRVAEALAEMVDNQRQLADLVL
jgi:hypothetical protein